MELLVAPADRAPAEEQQRRREGGEARVLAKLAPIVQASGSFSVENWLNLATADGAYVAPIIAELDEAKKLQ